MKLKRKLTITEIEEKKRLHPRCRALIWAGHNKKNAHERRCRREAKTDQPYCPYHMTRNSANVSSAGVSVGYGVGSFRRLVRAYTARYQGRVWDCTQEVALLRAYIQKLVEELQFQPWGVRIDHLQKLAATVGEIGKIGEKHARIEDGLKLKIEFKELQTFVSYIVGVINANVEDSEAKSRIAGRLGDYMEKIEHRDPWAINGNGTNGNGKH